ncbi:hypothetical protein RHMOL_Rhmol02G0244100 [Rhododendron molle]|uniref:Uncharacterized protein n=1 Tax=Rhododendron molle TaxID=49168 RepID=A0ACC0PWR0_RHOML|nr:hypothetical protein RHMOL_Rhmol02G0244100 [Rhododendron molle]
MHTPTFASWTIRKIFKLRPMVQPWITYVIGNGRNTFLWLDNWHPLGPLFAKFGSRVVYNLGRSLQTKVDFMIVNNQWQWLRARNPAIREILRTTPNSLVSKVSHEDSVVWNLNPNGKFSVSSAWHAFRNPKPLVAWYKVVWFKHAIRRWSIIQWLAVLGRLFKPAIPRTPDGPLSSG